MRQFKYYFFLPFSIVLIALACTSKSSTSSDQSGNWIARADFGGVGRSEAVSFVIGDTAYIGTGFDGTYHYNDLWSFNSEDNQKVGSWHQMANLPAPASPNNVFGRNSATAFAVLGKGYVTTGTDGYTRFKDTWCFDPKTNIWSQKSDFPEQPNPDGSPNGRYDAVSFALHNKGYLTSGYNGYATNDLWIYDPTVDTWTQGPSSGGEKRYQAVSFVYNNEGYVVTGVKNGINVRDFWKYNDSLNSWIQLRNISNTSTENYDDDYTDIVRQNAVGFQLANVGVPKAYLTLGKNGSYTAKTWEYDIATDLWTRKTSYERSVREGAVAFVVKLRGFVATGLASGTYYDDCDEFRPDQSLNTND